jgi:hypothetical protein
MTRRAALQAAGWGIAPVFVGQQVIGPGSHNPSAATGVMYEGGQEERTFAAQYRSWADASATWPRTCAMLRQIAGDWERAAEQADTRAELDQRRDSF